MDPDETLDVMKVMNIPGEKVYDVLDMSRDEFRELRWDMVDEWAEDHRYVDYFRHIGVNENAVREELQAIVIKGGADSATEVSGRLLLDSGIEEIELKHYLFFTEIMKYLGNESIKKGHVVMEGLEEAERTGLLDKMVSAFKDALGGERHGRK